MAAAGRRATPSADVLMYRCENTLTERWSLRQVGGRGGGAVKEHLARPQTEAPKERAAEKGEGSASAFIFQAVSRLFHCGGRDVFKPT